MHLVQQLARPGAALVNRHRATRAAVCIADRVRAALGDAGEERLRRERPL